MKKAIVAIIVLAVIGAAAFFLLVKRNSDDPRKEFGHPAANAKDFRRTVVLARVGPQ